MTRVADAPKNNWVDTLAPAPVQPYLRLARADRPIGIWLLLWPCWWSLALSGGSGSLLRDAWYLVLFAVGAAAMRAAGCTYNDILDRKYDAQVERTRNRPIPSGQVSVRQAAVFMLACCLAGFLVLIQFNLFTILLGISSLLIVAIYPLMKRITYWPQVVLGLAFSWGGLMGWASIRGHLDWAAIFVYLAAVFWTIGYDTIYAHQDKEDDALLGLRSTALKFGKSTPYWLSFFYVMTTVFLAGAGILAGAGAIFLMLLALSVIHLVWQIRTLDINDGHNCLVRFRSNRDYGAIVFASIILAQLVPGMP